MYDIRRLYVLVPDVLAVQILQRRCEVGAPWSESSFSMPSGIQIKISLSNESEKGLRTVTTDWIQEK